MANQAWQITSPGNLSLVDLGSEVPKPGPNQSLVRVQAVSLNYRDVLVVDHSPNYPLLAAPGLIPCSDGAGTIEATGGSNSRWRKGDRVVIHANDWLEGNDARDFVMEKTMGAGTADGTLRRWIVIDDDRLVKVPDGLTVEEACTIFTAGVTAWRSLMHGLIKLESGMSVLTLGTGGLSCYAIQIAAAVGARVIATSSSAEKLEVAKNFGASHLIDYRKTPQWAPEVLKVTDGEGVDIVVDVVGAGSIEQEIQSLRQGGLISHVGILSENPDKPVNIMPSLLFGAKSIQSFLGAGSRQLTEELSAFMEKHQIHPPIAKTFAFEEAPEALKALTKLTAPGKIVIKV